MTVTPDSIPIDSKPNSVDLPGSELAESSRAGQQDVPAPKSATLIVNASSRNGQESFETARRLLEENGVHIEAAHALEKGDSLEKLISDAAAKGSKLIVVGGGDGTFRSAAGSFARTDAILGVLPLGTVNDFARNLGIEPNLEAACKVIAEGKTALIDLAQAHDDCFLITASMGLSALAQTSLSPRLKKVLGPLGYLVATMLAWRRLRHLEVTLKHDGKTERMRVMQAGVINGHSWMGGQCEIPGVSLESGRLAFYALPPQNNAGYLRIARQVRRGQFFNAPGLRAFTTQDITIETKHAHPLVLDGDLCGQTPVRLRVVPDALRVCVSQDFMKPGTANAT